MFDKIINNEPKINPKDFEKVMFTLEKRKMTFYNEGQEIGCILLTSQGI